MRIPFRKTDLIGLVGVALLVAWTPAYLAQDPAERPLSNGETFPVAAPREGMRAVLEIVVQEGTLPPQAYGPIVEMRFERADDTIPGAEHVFVQRFLPLAFQTDRLAYESDEATYHTYLGADGLAVWTERDELRRHETTDLRVHGGSAEAGCGTLTWLHHNVIRELKFAPEEVDWPWIAGWDLGGDDLACPANEVLDGPLPSSVVNRAAEHRGLPLYGQMMGRVDRMLDRFLADTRGQSLEACALEAGPIPAFHHFYAYANFFTFSGDPFGQHLADHLELLEPATVACDPRRSTESWGWLSPAFPVPVGHHLHLVDPEGATLLQIDVVPRTIEAGDGPLIPVKDPATVEAEPTPRHLPDHDVPRVSLSSLRDHRSELMHGLSLAEVYDQVDRNSVGDMAAFMAKGPHLYAFWIAAEGPSEPDGPVQDGTRTSRWWMFLTTGSEARVLQAEIAQRSVPAPPTVQLRDLCTIGAGWQPCGPAFPVDLSAAIIDPRHALELMNEASPPEVNLLQPGSGQQTIIKAHPPTGDDGQTIPAAPRLYAWEAGHTLGPRSLSASGSLDAQSGHLRSRGSLEWTAEGERADEPPVLSPAPDGSAPIVFDPITSTAALTGILLVIAALLARLASGLKLGAHLPLVAFLYAKIHKDALLDNERREAILQLVVQDPGITLKDIQHRLGYGWGATVHHIETLCRNGLVATLSHGRTRHHFPHDKHPARERVRMAAERDPLASAFLAAVAARPGASLAELGPALPQGMGGASRTGKRLAALGLVTKKRDGRHVRFFPNDVA